jgi:hypothetical protein
MVSFTTQPLYSWGKIPSTHWIGCWVDRRAGLDDMEKWKFLTLPGLELQPLSLEARSQSLYRPCYTSLHVYSAYALEGSICKYCLSVTNICLNM